VEYPYNITIAGAFIQKLYNSETLLSISVMTDDPNSQRFAKVVKDLRVKKGSNF
jgi:hypothetical protein